LPELRGRGIIGRGTWGEEGLRTNINEIRDDELTGSVIAKQLIAFVIPIWFGTFFQQLYNMMDAVFVGRFVGKAALAAVGGPSAQIVQLVINLFVELSAGSSVVIAQFFGAGSEKDVGRGVHTAMAIALVGGAALTAFGLVFSPALLRSMDAEGEIYALSLRFLDIYFLGMLFMTVYNLGSAVLRAQGDSKRPFYYLMTGCFTNIALDYLLICVLKMGVAGAALATLASQALTAVLVVRALRSLPGERKLRFKKIRLHKDILRSMLAIGVPESMQSVLYAISNILIQANIDGFGTDTIAAMSAYSKVDQFFWMTIDAFCIAITNLSGQFYGAGNVRGVRKGVKSCLLICAGVDVVLTSALLLGGRLLLGLFSPDPAVIAIGLGIQRLLLPFYVLYFCMAILTGALRGMGYSVVPMLITFVGVCLLRIVWLYTVVPLSPALTTTLVSYPATWAVTLAAFVVYYRKIVRKESALSGAAL